MRYLAFGRLLTLGVLLLAYGQVGFSERLPANAGMVLVESRHVDVQSPMFMRAWLNAVARYTGKTELQLRRVPGVMPENLAKAVERYQFEAVPVRFWPDAKPVYWLHVFANKPALRNLVANNNLPVWLEERERVVVWLLDETESTPRLIEAAQDSSSAYWLHKRAEQAGLVFEFVSGNASLNPELNASDLQRFSGATVDKAQAAAGGSAFMLLRITLDSPLLTGGDVASQPDQTAVAGPVKWQMYFSAEQGYTLQKQGVALTVDAAARQIAVLVRQWQAARERVYPQERQDHAIRMDVIGLHDFADVQAVISALESLSVVREHRVRKSKPGQLQLVVQLSVTTDAFIRYLTRAGRYRVVQHNPLVVEKY